MHVYTHTLTHVNMNTCIHLHMSDALQCALPHYPVLLRNVMAYLLQYATLYGPYTFQPIHHKIVLDNG